VIPSGMRNSSNRISPGVTGANFVISAPPLLMIVRDFHVLGAVPEPAETDTISIVDPIGHALF
jgi:hypothetical protein